MSLKTVDRRLLTILLIVFVQMLGAAMILPILPLYAKSTFDLSPQAITLLVSAFFAAQFLAGPYLGRLSDRRGRIPVLIFSQIGTVLSFVMLGLAPSASFLYLARILDGITGGNIIVAQAYITDVTPRERRTEALGYIFAVFGIGFIIGPALGGFLSAALGPRVPYLIAAGAAALVVLLTHFTLDETVSAEQRQAGSSRFRRGGGLSPAEIRRNGSLLLVLLIGFVGQFSLGLLQSTFALYGEAVLFSEASAETVNLGIGLLLAVVGLGQFITQAFLIRPLTNRFGDSRLVALGNGLRTIGLFIFALISAPWPAAVGSLFFAMGMGLMMPPLQSLATRSVDDSERGGVLGIYQSVVSMATIISTAGAGLIFVIDPTMPYWLGGGLSLLVFLPVAVLMRRARRDQLLPPATAQSPAD